MARESLQNPWQSEHLHNNNHLCLAWRWACRVNQAYTGNCRTISLLDRTPPNPMYSNIALCGQKPLPNPKRSHQAPVAWSTSAICVSVGTNIHAYCAPDCVSPFRLDCPQDFDLPSTVAASRWPSSDDLLLLIWALSVVRLAGTSMGGSGESAGQWPRKKCQR